MHSNTIEHLHWDSDFFGFKIGKLELNQPNLDFGQIQDVIEQSEYRLIYCFVPSNILDRGIIEQKIPNALWVDGKTTYVKSLATSNSGSLSEFIVSVHQINDWIEDLAIQTGVFSRFKVDNHFEKDTYKKLYLQWIKNSLNRSIADDVLTYKIQEVPRGLITIGTKKGRVDIGLVGVDQSYRGKGIAQALIQAAEQYAIKNNVQEIQVVTQQQNIPACRLYEKCGYKKESVVNIYHIWKNN